MFPMGTVRIERAQGNAIGEWITIEFETFCWVKSIHTASHKTPGRLQ
jgi:hypothetical protein